MGEAADIANSREARFRGKVSTNTTASLLPYSDSSCELLRQAFNTAKRPSA
jgi:hypothetical protein